MSDNEKIEKTSADAQAASKPAKVEKKAKKDEKPGFFQRVARWFREMKSELKKVVWPTPKQTINNTVIVIVCVIVVGIFIWVFDALASGIIAALIDLFKG
ncbi:MAG TPA: preprotein translocase subunit SecE [Candidatus Intestinimonas merdavium]|uniref:Protein translocase subunit SecE n=1 Tax=Candidatus Intestinimonas merdavium TaxID=2838622 RepID=A0A9D1Z4R0_9FIRM|nr:preprotein translocase subunit SecE [Candidatus Intestinimonas merdavium]